MGQARGSLRFGLPQCYRGNLASASGIIDHRGGGSHGVVSSEGLPGSTLPYMMMSLEPLCDALRGGLGVQSVCQDTA